MRTSVWWVVSGGNLDVGWTGWELLRALLPNIAFPHTVDGVALAHSSEPNVIMQSGAALEFEEEEEDMCLFKEFMKYTEIYF